MEQPGCSPEAARTRMSALLEEKIIHPDTLDAFIPFGDIQRVWSADETIRAVLQPARISLNDIVFVREKLLRTLSILVYIGAHTILENVHQIWFQDGDTVGLTDAGLPASKESLLWLGSSSLQRSFQSEQFLFIPEDIIESEVTRNINDQRRLPFSSVIKEISSGAYGAVDKVEVCPLHFITQSGDFNRTARIVACKMFHASHSSTHPIVKRELENLQLLKASSTSHSHIRTHLSVYFHRGRHLILLPWADRHDVALFLSEGHDFAGHRVYDFERLFPGILSDKITATSAVLNQMRHIADALRWLHNGILPHGTYNGRIYFAHMDLKPDNILIENDTRAQHTSPIGKWILTDFGLSAFKEDDQLYTSNFTSFHDYHERELSMHTKPRRAPGSYQPPEIELDFRRLDGRSSAQIEGTAGRRGDVWSFGCILAEVIVFALGNAAGVRGFRSARANGYNNDYFYERKPSKEAKISEGQKDYQVREAAVRWLNDLASTPNTRNRTIDCCVRTILDILTVDGEGRPKSRQLLMMMEHLSHHTRSHPGRVPNCRIQQPDDKAVPTISAIAHDSASVDSLQVEEDLQRSESPETSSQEELIEAQVEPSVSDEPDKIADEFSTAQVASVDFASLCEHCGNWCMGRCPSVCHTETRLAPGPRKDEAPGAGPSTHLDHDHRRPDSEANRDLPGELDHDLAEQANELSETPNMKRVPTAIRDIHEPASPQVSRAITHAETPSLFNSTVRTKRPQARSSQQSNSPDTDLESDMHPAKVATHSETSLDTATSRQKAVVRRMPSPELPLTIRVKKVIRVPLDDTPDSWTTPSMVGPIVIPGRFTPGRKGEYVNQTVYQDVLNPDWHPKVPDPEHIAARYVPISDLRSNRNFSWSLKTGIYNNLQIEDSSGVFESVFCQSGRHLAVLARMDSGIILKGYDLSYPSETVFPMYFLDLGSGIEWARLFLAANCVVILTRGGDAVTYRILDHENFKTKYLHRVVQLSGVRSVAISLRGSVAFVIGDRVLYLNACNPQAAVTQVDEVRSGSGSSFSAIAFNENGDHLYVWETKRSSSCLHTWYITQNGNELHSQGFHDYTLKMPMWKFHPFNNRNGCLIETKQREFGVCDVETSRRLPQASESHIVAFPKCIFACLYRDDMLVIAEEDRGSTSFGYCYLDLDNNVILASTKMLFRNKTPKTIKIGKLPSPASGIRNIKVVESNEAGQEYMLIRVLLKSNDIVRMVAVPVDRNKD